MSVGDGLMTRRQTPALLGVFWMDFSFPAAANFTQQAHSFNQSERAAPSCLPPSFSTDTELVPARTIMFPLTMASGHTPTADELSSAVAAILKEEVRDDSVVHAASLPVRVPASPFPTSG
jgi:hypothetical protein